jgi:long-chain acyl-CoA synthetase
MWGLLTLGAVNIPIYPTISATDYEYILNHSESLYCFVSDQEVYDKVKAIQKNVKSLKKIYSFDQIKGCAHWSELLDEGANTDHDNTVNQMRDRVKPEDLATIIYTSGTTGSAQRSYAKPRQRGIECHFEFQKTTSHYRRSDCTEFSAHLPYF